MARKDSPVLILGGGAWDLNKIVRAEYEDPFYTELALVSSIFTIPTNGHSGEVFSSRLLLV